MDSDYYEPEYETQYADIRVMTHIVVYKDEDGCYSLNGKGQPVIDDAAVDRILEEVLEEGDKEFGLYLEDWKVTGEDEEAFDIEVEFMAHIECGTETDDVTGGEYFTDYDEDKVRDLIDCYLCGASIEEFRTDFA